MLGHFLREEVQCQFFCFLCWNLNRLLGLLQKISVWSIQKLVFLAYSNRHFKTLQFLHKSKHNKKHFSSGSVVKNPPASIGDAGDLDLIPEWGISPRGWNGNPLQYFCLGTLMDRWAWQAVFHEITKSQTWLAHK